MKSTTLIGNYNLHPRGLTLAENQSVLYALSETDDGNTYDLYLNRINLNTLAITSINLRQGIKGGNPIIDLDVSF